MSAKLSSKNFYGGNLMVKCFVALVIFFCSVGNLFAQTETKVTINVDKVLIRTALERLQKETKVHFEGGNLAASKIRNLECPSYEICLIDYGCGKFNRKIHIMEQYP